MRLDEAIDELILQLVRAEAPLPLARLPQGMRGVPEALMFESLARLQKRGVISYSVADGDILISPAEPPPQKPRVPIAGPRGGYA